MDKSVKGLFAREVPDLVFMRANKKIFLAKQMKRKVKPLFVLVRQTKPQRPRPWFPDRAEADTVTTNFFDRIFG